MRPLRSPVLRAACSSSLLLTLLGCGAAGDDVRPDPPDWTLHWAQTFDPTDDDGDGLPDEGEDWLLQKFAPEVRLAPDGIDQARPASVDWYLPQVHMRFDHPQCPDHELLAVGTVTQENLSQQTHATSSGIGFCSHTETVVRSSDAEKGFFLQPPSDTVHLGAPPSEWRVYAHAVASTETPGALNLQYWFWYPYNDWVATVNHEGDWEHITVVAKADGTLVGAFYAEHNGGTWHAAADLPLTAAGRPIVYSADGSHASYVRVGEFSQGPGFTDHTYDGGPIWRTWENLVNVGEKEKPLNGQVFIRYGGRWGEVGEVDATSGPDGPAFKTSWMGL